MTSEASPSGCVKKSPPLPEISQSDDFSSPGNFSDITLMVEDKPIYANKAILSMASPVWLEMLSGDYKESNENFVKLPDKKYDDVLELLEFVYPPCNIPITEQNVFKILPLSDEYQIEWLKKSCEDFLVKCMEGNFSSSMAKFCICSLHNAKLYGLSKVFPLIVQKAAEFPFSELKSTEMFKQLDLETVNALFEKRDEQCVEKIQLLDQANKTIDTLKINNDHLRGKCHIIAKKAIRLKSSCRGSLMSCDRPHDGYCVRCLATGNFFENMVEEFE